MKKTSKYLGSALAVTSIVGATVATAGAQATNIAFKIPAGPIDSVIAEFQRLTGLKVILSEPAIGTVQTPGVAGTMTIVKAIDILLAGTKVRATFGPKTVTLDLSQVAYQVNVTGEVMLASPKYTQPLRDTPQTVVVIPQVVFSQQNATTLRDVLRNTPGVTMSIGEGGTGFPSGDTVMIRGFNARADVFIDGTRDVGAVGRDAFNVESVEVAKGPSSVTTGRGSVGGSINLVTKAASLFNTAEVRMTGGTADHKRATVDVNRSLGRSSAFRVNAMWQDAGYPGRKFAEYKSWGVAPSLALGIGTPTTFTINYSHVTQDNIPDWGLPALLPDVATANHVTINDLDWNNFYGILSRDYEKTTSDLATATITHKFSPMFRLRNVTRFGRTLRDAVSTAPRPANPVAGQGPEDPGYNKSVAQMRRTDAKFHYRTDRLISNHTDVQSNFRTGDLSHAMDIGLELAGDHQPSVVFLDLFTNGRPPVADLFNPNPDVNYTPVVAKTGATTEGNATTTALYIFDTIQYRKFHFDLGLRYDHLKANYTNVTAAGVATRFDRTDKAASTRAGLVYKPTTRGSIYAAYSTSFLPAFDGSFGITMAATGVNSSSLAPEKTRNAEAGVKWDVRSMQLTAALFEIEKTNTRTTDSNGITVLAGDQQVRGIELGASGTITSRWAVFGGMSFMRGTVKASKVPLEVDQKMAYVPGRSMNLWTTYRFPVGLALGTGVNYESGHYFNQTGGFLFISGTSQPKYAENGAAIQALTGFWTASAMASYPVNRHLTLQINGTNLTDARWADRAYDRHFMPGPSRQVLFSPVITW